MEFPDMFAFIHLPLLGLLLIAVAVGNGYVARRLGRKPWLWGILTLIPVVNVFFLIYATFAVILYALDRLNDLSRREQRV